MKRYFLILLMMLMFVSPAFAFYDEYIPDGYQGTMELNNSVNLTTISLARHDPSGECPLATGGNYSDCVDEINWTSSVLPSYDGKTGVLKMESDYASDVNISMIVVSSHLGGENIWQYDDDKTVAFHTSFKFDNNTRLEGGEVRIYRDGNITTGTLAYQEDIDNTTSWQYFVWYGWDESWSSGDTTFTFYLMVDNWREMPVGTSIYFDDLRFFTVETELASPSSPSVATRRDMCNASGELASSDCVGCGSWSDTVSNKSLVGYIHKTAETGGGIWIPCITLFYDGITTSRIPIGDGDDPMYSTAWSESHFATWVRGNFHATTQDYKFIYTYYQIGTTPSYYYTHTLLFGFTQTQVEATTFKFTGGWWGSGKIECFTSGYIPQSVVSGGTSNLWMETIDISIYNCTGSQFRFLDYGAGSNQAIYTSSWIDIPFDFSPTCDAGWSCVGNQEYYTTSDCTVSSVTHCGVCGCGDNDRCRSALPHWECENELESKHYDEDCTEDAFVLCDLYCDEETGQCFGESPCVTDDDCDDLCYGDTLYSDPFCNLETANCNWASEDVCDYGCNSYTNACNPLPPPEPAFQDTSTLGIIEDITGGVTGFLQYISRPVIALIFIGFVGMLIWALFSIWR